MFEFLKKLVKKTPEKKTSEKTPFVKKSISKKPKVVKPKVVKPKLIKPKVVKPKVVKPKVVKPKVVKPKVVKPKVVKPIEKKSGIFSFAEKIKTGLSKTREKLSSQLGDLFHVNKIDENFYEELEMILLSADVGTAASSFLIEKVKFSVKENNISDPKKLKDLLKLEIAKLLEKVEAPLIVKNTYPFVIMMVGVNGTGKTTTIGKLTKLLIDKKHNVLIAAGDTFRAAASEQLDVWGERNKVQVISQTKGDPSAVIFDAVNSAKAKNIDIVIADTAGRLPTQRNLIDEITKIKRVINKCHNQAPQEILLVIDANTGQNAINQLKVFNEALGITGLVMTKLDGTAKGGVVAAIAKELPIPIRFIGVGEGIDDLRVFNAKDYAEAMFE
jgi:fused signal recognition particle receptor